MLEIKLMIVFFFSSAFFTQNNVRNKIAVVSLEIVRMHRRSSADIASQRFFLSRGRSDRIF